MDSLICITCSLENNAFSVLHYVMVALHYSMLHRFEIFSAPGTIAHGSIRLPPRSLASSRGCSLVYNNKVLNGATNSNFLHVLTFKVYFIIDGVTSSVKVYYIYGYICDNSNAFVGLSKATKKCHFLSLFFCFFCYPTLILPEGDHDKLKKYTRKRKRRMV